MKHIFWIFLSIILTCILYFSMLNNFPVCDDFQFIFPDYVKQPFKYFIEAIPNCRSYRPLQAIVLFYIQSWFGTFNTLPVHSLNLFVHCLTSVFIYYAIFTISKDLCTARLALLIFVTAPGNVLAVSSYDCLSQLLVSIFGYGSIFSLFMFLKKQTFSIRILLLCLGLLICAFLSKETAVVFIPPLMLLLLFHRSNFTIKTKAAICFVFLLIVFLYFTGRGYLSVRQPLFGTGRYNLSFNINCLINSGILLLFSIFPFSTVTLYRSLVNASYIFFFISCIMIIILLYIIFHQYFLKNTDFTKIKENYVQFIFSGNRLVIVLLIGSLLPIACINHVSELYAYHFTPACAGILGFALAGLIKKSKKKVSTYIYIFCTFLIIAQCISVLTKNSHLSRVSNTAQSMYSQLHKHCSALPDSSKVFCLISKDSNVEYSLFLVNSFNVLQYGLASIVHLWNRKDLQIFIIDKARTRTSKFYNITKNYYYFSDKSGTIVSLNDK